MPFERLDYRGRMTDAVLRAPTPRIDAAMVATGATALEVAEQCMLPAPRLIEADLQGVLAGVPVTLETVVPGTAAWPPPSSAERLRTAGAALARVHAVAMAPREPAVPATTDRRGRLRRRPPCGPDADDTTAAESR
ncbi:phosphotransferase [Actinopolymorpha sp. B9G3]|uniref:phosphotransferase n=1 Tax=Actinopolymorpha sp. B9G3 TaxID=3158970 RepID=UPI0032D8B575